MRPSMGLDGLTLFLRSEVRCASLTVARLPAHFALFPGVSFSPRYFFSMIQDKFHGVTFPFFFSGGLFLQDCSTVIGLVQRLSLIMLL
jgi:hypothetical protein